MTNALSLSAGPPPAPNPGDTQQGMPGAPMGAAQPGPQSGAPQQPAPPPAPSHQQTVAALRHFGAIEKELSAILADPDVGRADMKSKIIDGTTTLVGAGIMTPAAAVQALGTVPERPYDQKAWLEKQLMQTVQAADGVLDHHRSAFPGMPAPSPESAIPSMDDHVGVMKGLMGHYGGGNA